MLTNASFFAIIIAGVIIVIEQSVIDRYLDETTFNVSKASRVNLYNLLTKFFNLKPSVEFADLTKADLIEMYSQLMQTSGSFIAHKSKINDFAKWMYEEGYGTIQLLNDISELQYSDVNRESLYQSYYFRDIEELWELMSIVFSERGSEFDTFKSAALLVWLGIEINDLTEMLKSDLNEDDMSIVHPITKQVIQIPDIDLHDKIFYFLISYRDAISYDTAKFGGCTFSYAPSAYLFRSYKNAHFTPNQLKHISYNANNLAKEYKKVFQWNRIFQSGLYYRIDQYEKEHGSIEGKINILELFFKCNQRHSLQRDATLSRKYKEYQEFKLRLNL